MIGVTGLGAVTPLGPGVDALRRGVATGACGIGPLTRFAYRGRSAVAAEAEDPGIPDDLGLSRADARRLSRSDRYALAAVREAVAAAGLEATSRAAAAIAVGGTVGGVAEVEAEFRRVREGGHRWRASRALALPPSTTATAVAQGLGIFGPRVTFSTACSSSALAIGAAADAIARGEAAVALAIGTDALCPVTYAGFDALQALDAEPCRPFDRERRGLSLGEGAAALVLEDVAHARARGAVVWAILRGWGTSTDAHHVTAPHPEGVGAVAALERALAAAEVSPDAVDYVNAHGSGTPHNDGAEVTALRQVFGARLPRIPVSSSKSQVGHCLGGAGAVEAAVTLVALQDGIVPPTVHCRTPDAAWADLDFVQTPGRRAAIGTAVPSSYGFGGHNVTLVLSRPEAC